MTRNSQTRLTYDTCARNAREHQSARLGDYLTSTPGRRWAESTNEYATNMSEPYHYQKVYKSGHKVDTETKLQHSSLTSPRLIHQIYTRPYLGSFMGAGQASLTNKDLESELYHGLTTRDGRACNLSGVSIDRFECLPEYGNPQRVEHVVEPWIRGGDNTRDHVRRINYERKLKNLKNNGVINRKVEG
jgi:hypothetical protein